ncbi:MAG: helix-turn-helix domain-containing protein, partial [Thermoanaerobaculia bacterium]
LVELKLQIEELRSRINQAGVFQPGDGGWGVQSAESRVIASNSREVQAVVEKPVVANAIEPRRAEVKAADVMIAPGMTMAEIERAAITSALSATKGNRRKAAEMLGIGERTMYRKLRDYGIPSR